jgi:hypothetical protein
MEWNSAALLHEATTSDARVHRDTYVGSGTRTFATRVGNVKTRLPPR